MNGSRDIIELVKEKIDIREIVAEGIELNNKHKARCPFHAETNPSFSVNVKKQYFHCFGCGAGGDVFTYLQLHNKMSFEQALVYLAERAGVQVTNLSDQEIEVIERERTKSDILSEAAKFYHSQLTQEIEDYLIKDRCLLPETISQFFIGYASGGLRAHLENQGFPFSLCKEAGVIRDDGKDFFYDVIAIPYYYRGQVEQIKARTNPSANEKTYFSLPGYRNRIFNSDALHGADKIVVSEGEFDAILLNQLGFDAVGIPGAGNFQEEWLDKFNKVKIVYLSLDADGPGKDGADKIAELSGEKAKIVELPDGQDITDFFLGGKTSEDFRQLLDQAKTRLELKVRSITLLPENQRTEALKELLLSISKLSPLEVSHYQNLICGSLEIGKRNFDRALKAAHDDNKQASANSSGPVEKNEFEMSEEEKQEAIGLLSNEGLLKEFLKDCERLNCVGEEDNKLILYLAMTSRILDDPINIIVKGESSAGKSYTVNCVKQFIPTEDVLEFTTMSPKALYHRKDEIAHKLMIMHERAGAEDTDYPLRILQSEKMLKFSTTVKDDATNKFQTEDIEVKGPVAYVETTTKTHLHAENETRCFEIFPDESQQQTERIISLQNRLYSGEDIPYSKDVLLKRWQNAQRLLTAFPVIIPYVRFIDFPKEQIRARRDYIRFLTLIRANANLHQFQRDKTNRNGQVHLYADFMDYSIAYRLGQKLLASTVQGLGPRGKDLMKTIWSVATTKAQCQKKQPQEVNLTRREIENAIGWSRATVTKYLMSLEQTGYIDILKQGQGKAWILKVVKRPDEKPNHLLPPNELLERYRNSQGEQDLSNTGRIEIRQDSNLVIKELR